MGEVSNPQESHGFPVPDLTAVLNDEERRQILSLPEKEQRYLYGIALWLNRHSLREAARLSGIRDHTSLLYRIRKLHLNDFQRNHIAEKVGDMAGAIADEAGRQTLEKLHEGTFSDAQLPVIYGIATDKLVKAAQIGQPKDTGGELHKVLEMLQEQGGGQVTLGYQPGHERPVERVVDVESEDG